MCERRKCEGCMEECEMYGVNDGVIVEEMKGMMVEDGFEKEVW